MTARQRELYPIVGVIHLPPLPGSARGGSARRFGAILDAARRDADAWASGGAAALIVENFGDVPFARDAVGPHVVAAMTVVVDALRRDVGLPIGVNVLRNDVLAAVSIAALAGGSFVRANVYVGAALTDQGMIEGRAHVVQALIRRLDAPLSVWADVDVKHAAQVAPRPLGDLAEDAVERGLAGALIVSGRATGQPVALDDLRQARRSAPTTPLYVGSGATVERMPDLLAIADGAIVGTAGKVDGIIANPVDRERVRALVGASRAARSE
ncbi:MAG TPA: BtpA/SgcQ family protein [Thermomicrobiales bacterium]|nr:BtpA/SgcQ family protein [Thermomicrobiales bacterium]